MLEQGHIQLIHTDMTTFLVKILDASCSSEAPHDPSYSLLPSLGKHSEVNKWAWRILFHPLICICSTLLVLLLYWLWNTFRITWIFVVHLIPTHHYVFISHCFSLRCQQHWNFYILYLDLYTNLFHSTENSLGAGIPYQGDSKARLGIYCTLSWSSFRCHECYLHSHCLWAGGKEQFYFHFIGLRERFQEFI